MNKKIIRARYEIDENFITVYSDNTVYTIARATHEYACKAVGDITATGVILTQNMFDGGEERAPLFGEFVFSDSRMESCKVLVLEVMDMDDFKRYISYEENITIKFSKPNYKMCGLKMGKAYGLKTTGSVVLVELSENNFMEVKYIG